MMYFFRHPEEKDRTASNLLAALDARHPLSFAVYLDQLAQGIQPAEVGAAIGQALAEREQQCTRAQQERDQWREQAESYRLAWESLRETDKVNEAQERIAILETQLAEERALSERQAAQLTYLQAETARQENLLRQQNEIIAAQQMQLAAWDEQE